MTDRNAMVGPDLDTTLDVLANKYRRRVLVALLDHDPQSDYDSQILNDITLGAEDLEALMIRMHHSHLPKLEEAGFIEWNQETNTVEKGPQFEEIRPLLRLMENHADELPRDWL
jgi:predicted transcriptional regulator